MATLGARVRSSDLIDHRGCSLRVDVWNRLLQACAPPDKSPRHGAVLRALRSADRGSMRPQLASDVEVAHFSARWGSAYTMVKHPRGPIYFRLTAEEGAMLSLLDGTRTVKEIAAPGSSGMLDADVVVGLVDLLYENGFLEQRWIDGRGTLRKRPVSRYQARSTRDTKTRGF